MYTYCTDVLYSYIFIKFILKRTRTRVATVVTPLSWFPKLLYTNTDCVSVLPSTLCQYTMSTNNNGTIYQRRWLMGQCLINTTRRTCLLVSRERVVETVSTNVIMIMSSLEVVEIQTVSTMFYEIIMCS